MARWALKHADSLASTNTRSTVSSRLRSSAAVRGLDLAVAPELVGLQLRDRTGRLASVEGVLGWIGVSLGGLCAASEGFGLPAVMWALFMGRLTLAVGIVVSGSPREGQARSGGSVRRRANAAASWAAQGQSRERRRIRWRAWLMMRPDW